MLLKSSSLLQILLLLALVVSLTASPMEVSDDETSSKEEKIKKAEENTLIGNFFADSNIKRSLKKAGTKMLFTVLNGIICNEETFGRSACSAPVRYDDDNHTDLFREHYPEISFLHFIYRCRAIELNKWSRAYYWERERCPADTPFCGVQRQQKDPNKKVETKTQRVQVLCMGEGILKGNKNYVNANPGVDQKEIDKLGDRVKYVNQYTITDHPKVKKSDAINLGLVIQTKKYMKLLESLTPKEEPPQVPIKEAVSQKLNQFKNLFAKKET